MSRVLPAYASTYYQGRPSRCARRTVILAVLLSLTASFWACKSRSPELQSNSSNVSATTDKPLAAFSQEITSATHELTVSPGGVFAVPVTIKNPTDESWSSFGKYPVVVSYMWFDSGVMFPPESERTLLPAVVPPGGSVAVTVKGKAPQTGQKLLVKITLVQEGVAWFNVSGAKSLEIPVELAK